MASSSTNTAHKKVIFLSVFMSLALLITALSSIYLFQEYRLELNNNIHSDQPLIVLNYLGSALPAAGLGLLVLSIAFANQVYLRLTNKHDPKKPDKLTRYCGYALLICLMGLLISRSYLNNLWDNQAKQQGYQPCPSITLLKSSLTRTAWARDENLCYDPKISKILRYGNERELAEIQAYLRQK